MEKDQLAIGCSSFNESYWKGIFYPEDLPRKDWFAFYCTHFNTYEMNGTFYKFPTAKSLASWFDKSPPGFLFSVKMYKGVTHFKKFTDCKREIDEFYAVCRDNLREKLACVLFQLPPSFSYTPERLQQIVDALDYSFDNVIEFRHASWWNDEVFDILRQKNIVFCNVSYPKLPENIVATSSIGYVRQHGVPKLFYSDYDADALKRWRDGMLSQDWYKSFIYFNNTASASGIKNALAMKDLNAAS